MTQPPGAPREKEGFSSRALEGSVALLTSWFRPSETDFGLPASRAGEEYISRHQVCSNLLQWQQEISAVGITSPLTDRETEAQTIQLLRW